MNTNPHIQAVVEVMMDKGDSLCPWPVADCKKLWSIRLSGKTTDLEVGLIFAQLVNSNRLENEGDANNLLHQVLQSYTLILPGGLQVRSADKVIDPGCCCGLEMWRNWSRFLKTGQSPWLGHDPSPWIEKRKNLICVWSDRKGKIFHIDFELSKFKAELNKVQQDLSGFLARIEEWADRVGFPEPSKLSRKFDECFYVSHYPRSLPRRR